jgi:hypothetical protein
MNGYLSKWEFHSTHTCSARYAGDWVKFNWGITVRMISGCACQWLYSVNMERIAVSGFRTWWNTCLNLIVAQLIFDPQKSLHLSIGLVASSHDTIPLGVGAFESWLILKNRADISLAIIVVPLLADPVIKRFFTKYFVLLQFLGGKRRVSRIAWHSLFKIRGGWADMWLCDDPLLADKYDVPQSHIMASTRNIWQVREQTRVMLVIVFLSWPPTTTQSFIIQNVWVATKTSTSTPQLWRQYRQHPQSNIHATLVVVMSSS